MTDNWTSLNPTLFDLNGQFIQQWMYVCMRTHNPHTYVHAEHSYICARRTFIRMHTQNTHMYAHALMYAHAQQSYIYARRTFIHMRTQNIHTYAHVEYSYTCARLTLTCMWTHICMRTQNTDMYAYALMYAHAEPSFMLLQLLPNDLDVCNKDSVHVITLHLTLTLCTALSPYM